MYNAIELARRAFYAAHYARLEKAGGKDPAMMIEAAHYYLNHLAKVPHEGYERLMTDIENMLEGIA